MNQDMFSWNNQSVISPTSDAHTDLLPGLTSDELSRNILRMKGRTQTPNMHVMGAFKDHSTKPVATNRDLQRSEIRTNQLNKTQQFFMQASKNPDLDNRQRGSLMEHQLEVEDVIGREKSN